MQVLAASIEKKNIDMPMARFVHRARDYNGKKKVHESIGHLLPTVRDDTQGLESHPLFTHGKF